MLNPLTLALLAALLGGALRYGRRWPKATQLLVLVVALAGAGLVWAALVRDGQTSDWAGVPPLATQSSAVTGPAQLVALYGKVDGGNVNFRIDAGIAINQTPQVDAGTDQIVTLPAGASLNGNVTDDGLPNPPGTVTVTWSQDSGPGTVTFGSANTQATTATFSVAGSYVLHLTADDGEKSAFDTVMVTVNSAGGGGSNQAPQVDAGTDQTITLPADANLSGNVTDDGLPNPPGTITITWSMDSGPGTVTFGNAHAASTTATFSTDGVYVLRLTANDGALPASDTVRVTVNPASSGGGNQAPRVSAGNSQTITLPDSANLNGTVTDDGLPNPPGAVTVTWSMDSGPGTVTFGDAAQQDTTASFSTAGVYVLRLTADDGALTEFATVTVTVNPEPVGSLPPDPKTVAPKINATVATTVFAATEFLYTGTDPIQTGVAPGTIDPKRAAVLRGRVLDKQNNPLSGVTLTVLNHPEFGQTLSRADGWFDLVVNGGGYLTLSYQKTGYLPAQRQANAPWQDYVVVEDAVLVVLDSQVTSIDLEASVPFQVARGSVVTDTDGTRQATLLFPQGTTATMTLPDGMDQPLSTLQVRATEYTVGTNGPQTMPAELPPTSAYTYAVELSVDEAIAAGAKTVQFSQPIPFYVDNFLNFPVGIQVPLAYYDREKGAWIPIDDGRVIKILSIVGGVAQVDTTGDNAADNGMAIGMTEAERQQIASLYPAGKTLSRMAVTHFTPHDPNYPIVAASGAQPPQTEKTTGGDGGRIDNKPAITCSSIIECENQTLGEFIPVVGTGLNLNYRSDRVPGRKAANTLTIPLSGATVPSVLKRIELEITVAGRTSKQTFPAAPNQTHTFTWDGLDAYGRALQGTQPVSIRIGYVYDGFYALPPAGGRSFGLASGQRIPGDIPARQEVALWQDQKSSVSVAPDFRQAGVGGWSLDVHHVYDPIGQVLYQGDGGRRSAKVQGDAIITTVAGTGSRGFGGDGGLATQAMLNSPQDVAVAADGSILIADYFNNRIRRVGPNGIITTFAGNGQAGISGDGGLATQATLSFPLGLAVAADGSVLIAQTDNNVIRRVGPDGIITTIQATLSSPWGIAVEADGSILIADSRNSRIRKVGPDGIIATIAGNGSRLYSEGIPAIQAGLSTPLDVAVAVDGSVLIAVTGHEVIRRVGPDGIITTFAGNGQAGFSGDGGVATQASLNKPQSVAVMPDGSVLIADSRNNRVRRVGLDGIINTVAGNDSVWFSGDGNLATQSSLSPEGGLAIAPDGAVLIADIRNHRILRINSSIPGFSASDLAIASKDGRQLYRFNANGRHLSTVDTLTKTVLYSFGYDSAGRLISITDADNNITTIERDASGNPTAIVAPFGQRTTLTINGDGYLASVANPAGETHQLTYTADGLLTAFTDPKGNASQFTYDALGRLQRDANAANGSQNLARTELADGYTVTRRTALNRTTAYTVEDLPIGDRQRKVRAPDGTETLTLLGTNGSAKITAPDGSVTDTLDGPDPRFGMQAPITTSSKVTTGGLTATASSTATANPANPTDPLVFTSLTRTATLNGRTATSTYTAATRRTDSRSPANRQSYSILDDKGRVIESSVTGIDPVRMSYDARGRLASVAQGAGGNERITMLSYNAAGYLASATDALGQSGSLTYDPAGRVKTQTLANGQTIDFDYDANGNLTSLTPPGQPAHGFTYNAVNLVTAYTPPAVTGSGANSTTYAYNADKQVTQITRPDGGVLNYSYDSAGRLSTLSIPVGQYGYAYDSAGRLDGMTAPGGITLDYAYNGALLTGVTWSGGINGSVGYGYDTDFRVNSITVNGANPVTYQYDADSLLTRASFGAINLNLTRSSQNGLLTGTALGNANESYSYNSFGEVSGYTGRYSTTNLLTFTYTRDKLGRITQKAETVQGVTTTYDYAYDTIGQLVEVKQNGGVTATYAYDANGNRLSKTGPGINETGTYDAQDRMLSYDGATYGYTANGELQSKVQSGQTTSYNYDALGNLRQVTLPGGTQIEYLIDGQNRRIGKKINSTRVQGFLYQGQLKPVAELDGNENIVSRFVYAVGVNVPDYLVKGGVTYRILKDHLGSPRLVVDISTGMIAQRMDYDEYGKVLADSNPGFQPFGFAGGIYDRDAGLVRFGARDYEAGSGRWMSHDPRLTRNFFKYSLNNPVNYLDRNGEEPTKSSTIRTFMCTGTWENNSNNNAPSTLSEAIKRKANEVIPRLHPGESFVGYEFVSPGRSIWHTQCGQKQNVKIVFDDGSEGIYDWWTENIVTDPRNMGTYNSVNPGSWWRDIFHGIRDVIPYLACGNSSDDPSTFGERVSPILPRWLGWLAR